MVDTDVISQLLRLTNDDLDEHIFELYSRNAPLSNLGFINKKSDTITVSIPENDIDLVVRQSISQLSSKQPVQLDSYVGIPQFRW